VLPQPPTSFVGRESELAEARRLLATTRLLTLTGPGGVGKTRLAVELARRTAADFADGAVFVPLAAVRDPSLVPGEIAAALGLQDSRGTPLLDHVAASLTGRRVLLIIDNMEQVLEASTFVADLLAAADTVRIVATSRAPLHVASEQQFPVPPLSEAVQLFAARAAAAVPEFSVTDANTATLGEIADRLGGVPLAIELAAARISVLPPDEILKRLDDSLGLLVSENRDVPDRQRTLRATIAWSHDLMSAPARRLLAICSVFRGGIDLRVLEQVGAALDLSVPVIDLVAELVDHSLLRRTEPASAPRFTMLEAVREFAAEQLDEPSELAARTAHAEAMWRLVADLRRPPSTPDRPGLDLLDLEHDNLRAALDHCAGIDPPMALRMANRLAGFWTIRGYFSEGRRRLSGLREQVAEDDPEYADAMAGEAWLATDQGDRDAALPLLRSVIARARAAGDVVREAEALLSRGRAQLVIGDPAGGRADVEASLALQEASGDAAGLAAALWLGGAAAHFAGELELAHERFERAVALATAADEPATATRALYLLGSVRLDLGDPAGAEDALAVALPAVVELGDRFAMTIALSMLAGLAAQRGRPRTALRLAGTAAGYEAENQTRRPQFVRARL
jgi:non-specific serine/threonine protein kinase